MKVYTHGHGNPKVTIIGSIHGYEPSGKKIIQKLNNKFDKQLPHENSLIILHNNS